jgi:uracil-DNA glycosylase family 4
MPRSTPNRRAREALQTILDTRLDVFDIMGCKACPELQGRQRVVLGRNDPRTDIHLIGEAPGQNEDELGLAFVGRAGGVLDMCIWKAKIDTPFIHNILKCRPPDNRDPLPEEFEHCRYHLQEVLDKFPPKVIVAMGRYSIGFFRGYDWPRIKAMTVTKEATGRTFRWLRKDGPVVVPAFHPAYLLRNPEVVPGFVNRLKLAQRYAKALTNQR